MILRENTSTNFHLGKFFGYEEDRRDNLRVQSPPRRAQIHNFRSEEDVGHARLHNERKLRPARRVRVRRQVFTGKARARRGSRPCRLAPVPVVRRTRRVFRKGGRHSRPRARRDGARLRLGVGRRPGDLSRRRSCGRQRVFSSRGRAVERRGGLRVRAPRGGASHRPRDRRRFCLAERYARIRVRKTVPKHWVRSGASRGAASSRVLRRRDKSGVRLPSRPFQYREDSLLPRQTLVRLVRSRVRDHQQTRKVRSRVVRRRRYVPTRRDEEVHGRKAPPRRALLLPRHHEKRSCGRARLHAPSRRERRGERDTRRRTRRRDRDEARGR